MSELIVEMEMPTVCDECPMLYDGIVCAATGTEVYPNRQARILKNGRAFDPCENRLDDCPIVGVLPEEHGDLIDRDVIYKDIELWKSTATDTITMCFLYHIEKLLMCIRPIIEAERKDDDKQRSNIYS